MRNLLVAVALAVLAAAFSPTALADAGMGQRYLPPEKVATRVRQYLATRLDLGGGQAEVRSVHVPSRRISVPEGPLDMRVEAPANTRFLGRTPLLVVMRVGGAEVKRLWVSADVAVYTDVAVPNRPLRARERLSAGMFETRRRNLAEIPSDAVTRPEDLDGALLLRPMAPGEVVRKSDVRPPRLVSQGNLVRMIARRGGVTITTVGKALDHGRLGQAIRVMNVDSHKVVQGRVVDRSTVEVLF